jgi:transcriptional regulator with XRE-family HTH domain
MGDEGPRRERGRPRSAPLWRTFLSHTAELRDSPESRSFVAAAEAAVIRAGHAVTDMAYFTARDHGPAEYCEGMVAEADIYVGIIGLRYGTPVRGRPAKSYTELEYEAATRLGLPRLIFMVREGSPSLPLVDQSAEHAARQAAFRRRLLEEDGVTVATIATPADLEIGLFHALTELKQDHSRPHYPNRLAQLRGGGHSQEEMAERVGVSLTTYRNWEAGRHRPHPRAVRALCEIHRVHERDLGFSRRPDTGMPELVSPVSLRDAAPSAPFTPHSTRWGTLIGRLWFPWVVASYGPYRPEHIDSYYTPVEPTYPAEIEDAYAALREDIARRGSLGDEVPYNSDGYKLVRFHVSSRAGTSEEPKLALHFAPTDFFRMLVTDQRLDVPLTAAGRTYTLRERYAADVDLRVAPVPELATHWGAGLSVVTRDGLLLVSERGNTAVDPHVYFPAVAEGATRPMDATGNGAPNHFTTAQRGVLEELGVELHREELTWLSFGANSYLCEYGLIGMVRTRHTLREIESHRSIGAAKDSWETKRLHAMEFNPTSVARFCSESGRRFSPFALITLVHALLHQFGVSDTTLAFESASISVTQHLPQWLNAQSG